MASFPTSSGKRTRNDDRKGYIAVIYAHNMDSPARLLTSARLSAKLSIRALAARAGVAHSTVTRIESGRMDPTIGMLERLLLSAGCELQLTGRSLRSPQLGDLTQAWATDPSGQDRPEWTHIRGFLDYLTLNPDAVAPSTAQMPEPSGSDFMDNLLAGIAEKACDDAGIARPSWTRHVPPLTHRWASPGTPRMRQRAMELTPPQLASRGINMTADSLWRNPLRMVANTDSHLVG